MARTKIREVKRKATSTATSKGLASSTPSSRAGSARRLASPPDSRTGSGASFQSSSDTPSAPPPTNNRSPLPRGQFTTDLKPRVWQEEDGTWVVERQEGTAYEFEYEYEYAQRDNAVEDKVEDTVDISRNSTPSNLDAEPPSGSPPSGSPPSESPPSESPPAPARRELAYA